MQASTPEPPLQHGRWVEHPTRENGSIFPSALYGSETWSSSVSAVSDIFDSDFAAVNVSSFSTRILSLSSATAGFGF
jgi:hypothetical protein